MSPIQLNIGDLCKIKLVVIHDNGMGLFQSIETKASLHHYGHLLGHLKKIQKRDVHAVFTAKNPWVTKGDTHACLPGIPDDEAALLLFSILFDISQFRFK